MTKNIKIIQKIIKENKGFITATQVTKAGIPRHYLSKMEEEGAVYRSDRGIYVLPEVWEDELYFLQYRFSKGIFSHETALYLHDITDRTPIKYTMTFPNGYNTGNVRKKSVIAKLTTLENYNLGVVKILSPSGNFIRVYDVERTLCDIVKVKHNADIQIVNQAMKIYARSKDKDIAKILNYAEKLRVKPKILTYMEILL
ncbi:MAG: type IV toxin-antitoxin system AbiEi family antitoxin domain-containing protein [Clostridiales bacterium]|nr:type IV toxin-antitoxin system AbiEi family antitoxin domain-containing protein [Clostridiales bacterium]